MADENYKNEARAAAERAWAELAERERAESPDGKTGFDRLLEREERREAERRQQAERRQGERRQPTAVPEAGRCSLASGMAHALHVFTQTPEDYELIQSPGRHMLARHPGRRLAARPVTVRGGFKAGGWHVLVNGGRRRQQVGLCLDVGYDRRGVELSGALLWLWWGVEVWR